VARSSDPALVGYQWRPHQLDRTGPLIVSQGSWFAVLRPIDGGWLDVRFSNDSLAEAESKLFSTLVAAATPLWLFMLAVAFWLLGREAVNPIQRLVRAMQRARAGEQDVRADEGRPDEIGKAARKFDRTLEALLHSQQELQRAYEARMVRADRFAAIGQMATGLAHEIKNPLAGLSGALELLAEDMQKSTHAEVIGEMQNQVTRLSEIMEGLLSYARPPRANLTSTQVNDVLEKVLFLLAHQKHRTARIVREFDPSLPAAHADPSQLQQVFLNVILNAYEAVNGSGGTITVRTSADAEGVLVEIADTGPGIPEAIRPDIFTPFFTTRTTGTGLGLAISARLMSEHGGRISFRCPPEGGTVFTIRLLKDQPVELAKTA
jgi:C4-dicarboxylate-specific signal transduction histidine kinase